MFTKYIKTSDIKKELRKVIEFEEKRPPHNWNNSKINWSKDKQEGFIKGLKVLLEML